MERESMAFDVVIVGAGPAGLTAAIHLKQLADKEKKELSVCVIEKGSEIGAHTLSGAVLEPRTLDELFPDWQAMGAPVTIKASEDHFYYLTADKHYRLPTPKPMKNKGNYIIRLGLFVRWLAEQAESLGVEIYPGFAASDIIYDDNGQVIGVATGDMGLDKNGSASANFQPGMHLLAQQTLFAEGCRGSLSERLIQRFELRDPSCPQTYGLGIKEIWQIKPEKHSQGTIVHSVGWPMDSKTYGGSFIYHLDNTQVAIGFVVGLDYKNPWLSPFHEFQRFKTHPMISNVLDGGERLSYGARALNEGGYQALPKLTFPGGALIGCSAGFLNVPKIKGIHTAMKSGMLAARAIIDNIVTQGSEIKQYPSMFKASWAHEELYRVRNIRPSFHRGLWHGIVYSAIDTYLFGGRAPWTWRHKPDHEDLLAAKSAAKVNYPKPDGKLTFDRLSSVYLSGTFHEENQPVHLKLRNKELAISVNYDTYRSPETRYCPAGVYEIVETLTGDMKLQINAQNCIHCKTCDIKDPQQNIVWHCPEGGGGPNYSGM